MAKFDESMTTDDKIRIIREKISRRENEVEQILKNIQAKENHRQTILNHIENQKKHLIRLENKKAKEENKDE